MKMPEKLETGMIAPCGVNCLACSAHLGGKNPCPGGGGYGFQQLEMGTKQTVILLNFDSV